MAGRRGSGGDRPYGLIALLVGLVVLLGISLSVVAHDRPPPGSALPPEPPAAGQHGAVRYQAVGGQGGNEVDLLVASDGAFRIRSSDKSRPVSRSGRLPEPERTVLAALVGKACRTRFLTSYPVDVTDSTSTTLTFCGRTVTLTAGSSSVPTELDELTAALGRLSYRLAGRS